MVEGEGYVKGISRQGVRRFVYDPDNDVCRSQENDRPKVACAAPTIGRVTSRHHGSNTLSHYATFHSDDGSVIPLYGKLANARHHPPAGPIEIDDRQRVAGRVHAVVMRRG